MRDLDALMRDKLEIHCRQQLSAMLDGTLAPDQARFLLRRLQHDHELAGCWERWQVYGDLMRGSVPALLPADFSRRVQAALSGQDAAQAMAAAAAAPRMRWAGWAGGAALAASVAVAALFVSQRAPIDPLAPAEAGQQLAGSSSAQPAPAAPPRPAAPTPSAPPAPQPAALDAAGAVAATALAAAEAPRRAATRRERPAPARRAAAPARADAVVESPVPAAMAERSQPALAAEDLPPVEDLFVDQAIVPTRPWPRPILPGMSGSGAFTVDYGGNAARPGSGFDNFEPRLPAEPSATP